MTGSTYRAKSLPSLAENSRVSDRGAGGNPRSLNAHRCPVRHEVPFCFRLVRVRGPSGVAVKPVDTDARAELRLNSPKPSPSASEWVRCLDPINPPPIGLHSRPFRSTSSCQPTRSTNTRPALPRHSLPHPAFTTRGASLALLSHGVGVNPNLATDRHSSPWQ